MSYKREELVLKTAKEIVVKFIEVGNISPTSFHDHFRSIYQTVEASVRAAEAEAPEGSPQEPAGGKGGRQDRGRAKGVQKYPGGA
jgi:hypothetical protein